MTRESGPGRTSAVRAFEPQITTWLSEQTDLAASEIIRRLHDAGYRGSVNPVYERVAQLRPEPMPATPEVRFDGLPGEFAQFDFGQVRLRYLHSCAGSARSTIPRSPPSIQGIAPLGGQRRGCSMTC